MQPINSETILSKIIEKYGNINYKKNNDIIDNETIANGLSIGLINAENTLIGEKFDVLFPNYNVFKCIKPQHNTKKGKSCEHCGFVPANSKNNSDLQEEIVCFLINHDIVPFLDKKTEKEICAVWIKLNDSIQKLVRSLFSTEPEAKYYCISVGSKCRFDFVILRVFAKMQKHIEVRLSELKFTNQPNCHGITKIDVGQMSDIMCDPVQPNIVKPIMEEIEKIKLEIDIAEQSESQNLLILYRKHKNLSEKLQALTCAGLKYHNFDVDKIIKYTAIYLAKTYIFANSEGQFILYKIDEIPIDKLTFTSIDTEFFINYDNFKKIRINNKGKIKFQGTKYYDKLAIKF